MLYSESPAITDTAIDSLLTANNSFAQYPHPANSKNNKGIMNNSTIMDNKYIYI